MSQGSLIIPTTGTLSGLALVQAINAALANLASMASGATDPSTLSGGVAPLSLWMDTSVTPAVMRQRNSGNSGWQTPSLSVGHGQCRLSYVSTTQIKLAPINGNNLIINGVVQQVPSGGVTYTLSGLSASTLYYVYAYMNSGVMTLEASATGHVTGTNGVEVKSGDATRTLVGMVRTNASTQFVDTLAQRFVRTLFNDLGIAGLSSFTANRQTTSTSYVELHSEIRNEFLCWAGEIVVVGGSGISSQSSTGLNSVAVGFDGISNLELGSYSAGYVAAAGGFAVPYTINLPKPGLSEGYHYVTLAGKVQNGLGTWSGGTTLPTTPDQCTLTTYIRK